MSYATGVTTSATRTEQVYEVIRFDLLNGVLQPGQKLKMVELTERFGVSHFGRHTALLSSRAAIF